MIAKQEGTSRVQPTMTKPKITVMADGQGVASHAGSRQLADLSDRTGLTEALAATRQRSSVHASRPAPNRPGRHTCSSTPSALTPPSRDG